MENNLNAKVEQLRSELIKLGVSLITDEPEYLIKFLRARSLDVTSSVALIKSYTDYKAANPLMFNLPYRLKPVFDSNLMRILNTRSKTGEAIILFKPGNWNPSLFNFDRILSASLLTMEQAALDSETQKTGALLISDMECFGWKQMRHFSPFNAKKLATILEKVAPLRINEVVIFNQMKIAEMAWAVIKPFLSETLRCRVSFHGTDYKYFESKLQDNSMLPASIGGQSGQLAGSDHYRNLTNNESLFKSFGYS